MGKGGDAAEDDDKSSEQGSPAARGDLTERARRWTDTTESIRSRMDLFAKGISALGTGALSTLGIAKFADIFPLPEDTPWGWIVVTIAGFVLMGAMFGWFAAQLWNVNAPVFADLALESKDPDKDAKSVEEEYGLSNQELRRVKDVFRAEAGLRGRPTLGDYAAEAARAEDAGLARYARADVAARDLARANAMNAHLDEAQARAVVNVVRMRAKRTASTSAWLLIFFTIGLVGFGIGSDYLDTEHDGGIATAKSCAAAVRTIREVRDPPITPKVPGVCGDSTSDPNDPVARVEAGYAEAVRGLDAHYASCLADAAVTATNRDASDIAAEQARAKATCQKIARGLAALLSEQTK